MLVLVTYDVSTKDKAGARRLARVAKKCLDYGQRVQNSVFECVVTAEQFVRLKKELVEIIDPQQDSLRFYFLGNLNRHRVEHIGAKPTLDLEQGLLLT